MTPLKTALIGFGKVADTLRHDARMARYFPDASHAQVLKRHPAFDWVAVVDPSPDALVRAKQDWNIATCARDVAALPDREAITAAVIASPPEGRLAALEALPSLRTVLVEKPLGAAPGEGAAFVSACDRRGIKVQVNYWRRAVPAYRDLAAGGLEKMIGQVQTVFGVYGNGLMNNGSHMVDFLRMLCGEIEGVDGVGPTKAACSPIAGDDDIACLLRLSNGASVALTPVDFNHWREVGLDIWGTAGRVSILQESLAVYHYARRDNRGIEGEAEIDSGKPEMMEPDAGASLAAMYDNLADAVGADVPLLCPGRDAVRNEDVIQDIRARAATLYMAGGA